jgi:hypothetical protein
LGARVVDAAARSSIRTVLARPASDDKNVTARSDEWFENSHIGGRVDESDISWELMQSFVKVCSKPCGSTASGAATHHPPPRLKRLLRKLRRLPRSDPPLFVLMQEQPNQPVPNREETTVGIHRENSPDGNPQGIENLPFIGKAST